MINLRLRYFPDTSMLVSITKAITHKHIVFLENRSVSLTRKCPPWCPPNLSLPGTEDFCVESKCSVNVNVNESMLSLVF